MKAISIRLPDDLAARIIQIAGDEFRSVNQQIEFFLTAAVDDYRGPATRRLLSETERQEIVSPAEPKRKGPGKPQPASAQKAPSNPGGQVVPMRPRSIDPDEIPDF